MSGSAQGTLNYITFLQEDIAPRMNSLIYFRDSGDAFKIYTKVYKVYKGCSL